MEMRGFVARGEVAAAQPTTSMRNGFYISFGSEHKRLALQLSTHAVAAGSPARGTGKAPSPDLEDNQLIPCSSGAEDVYRKTSGTWALISE